MACHPTFPHSFLFFFQILQNLGKADKTTDEIFEEHLQNFNLQQLNANRLHKDVSNYIRCVRAMQSASKSLMETVGETYEPQWVGHDLLFVQAQNQEMLWADLAHKLSDQVLIPLTTYTVSGEDLNPESAEENRGEIDSAKSKFVWLCQSLFRLPSNL